MFSWLGLIVCAIVGLAGIVLTAAGAISDSWTMIVSGIVLGGIAILWARAGERA
jgi:hypothetical protein